MMKNYKPNKSLFLLLLSCLVVLKTNLLICLLSSSINSLSSLLTMDLNLVNEALSMNHDLEGDAKCSNKPISKHKRKISSKSLDDDNDKKPDEESEQNISSDPIRLTKKQRKKLAKQKEMELQNVVAEVNKHSDKKEEISKPSEKKGSLTRKRMIDAGIIVQDIIHGTGSIIRSGRKVSINYVGTFPESGKVFDKNTSKSNPLCFRVGTGEVIKGLDRGLAGMKVGGERIITIPPELAYGKKGSGNIPGNSTLCFSVKLLSVGGK